MEYAMSMGLDKKDLLSMSRVKGKLGVIFLSEMVTADGKHLETFAFDPEEQDVPQNKFTFPSEVPADHDWEVCGKKSGANTQWRTSSFTCPWEPGPPAHTEDGPGTTMKKTIVSRRGRAHTQSSISQQEMLEQDPACNMSKFGQEWKNRVGHLRLCKCWKDQELS